MKKIIKIFGIIAVFSVLLVVFIVIRKNISTTDYHNDYTFLQTINENNSSISKEEALSIVFNQCKKYGYNVKDYGAPNAYYRDNHTWAIEFTSNDETLSLDGAVTFIVDEEKKSIVDCWPDTCYYHP